LTRIREERQVLLLCFLTDLLIYWIALNVATLTRVHTLIYFDLATLQRDRLVCMLLFAGAAGLVGTCASARLSDRFDSIYYNWAALIVTGILQGVLVTLLPRDVRTISRRELVLALAIAGVLLALWRFALAGLTARFKSLHRFFYVFGSEAAAAAIVRSIRSSGLNADAQYVPRDELDAMLGRLGDEPAAGQTPMAEAVIALTSKDRDELAETLVLCERRFHRTFLYPCVHDTLFFRHTGLLAIAGIPFVEIAGQGPTMPYRYLKRAIDVLVAGIGLCAATPVCIVAALAIKATSPGPVIYAQERMGKDSRRFRLYKFRSMIEDAEDDTGPVLAEANDARVTTVGRFIRRHRIDEIPQLFNVLKGDMSLVGPRPERPHFHEEFCEKRPLFARRLAVRPGVTSLSHVLGSYDSDPDDRLRYDLVYIGNVSFLMDLKIFVATVRVVLGAKGAQ